MKKPATFTKEEIISAADKDFVATATPEECCADAKLYATREEWFDNSSQLFLIAGANDDLFDRCIAHMQGEHDNPVVPGPKDVSIDQKDKIATAMKTMKTMKTSASATPSMPPDDQA